MRRALLTATTLLGALAAHADDTTPIAKNPFVRPQLVELATSAAEAAASAMPFELRAVLVAGDASLANVSGRILRVGEVIDGHRLVSVSEAGALFEHGGRSVHIPLQPRVPAPALAQEATDAS